MMPASVVGVIVFLAAIAPGHLYLRCYERHATRDRRTGLREMAEMASFGALLTVIGALVAVGAAQVSTWFYPLRAVFDGANYLRDHPWAAVSSASLILGVSAVGCAVAGSLAGRRSGGGQARTSLGTPWSDVLSSIRDPQIRPYASVETADGHVIEGFVVSVAAGEAPEARDLALRAPIMLTTRELDRHLLPSAFAIVSASNIKLVTIALVSLAQSSSPPSVPKSPSPVSTPRPAGSRAVEADLESHASLGDPTVRVGSAGGPPDGPTAAVGGCDVLGGGVSPGLGQRG